MARNRPQWYPPNVSSLLLLLMAAILAPVLLVQAWLYRQEYRLRRDAELQANMEMARSTAAVFGTYLDGLQRWAVATGQGLVASPHSPREIGDHLATALGARPELRSLSWLSPTGRVLYSSNRALVGQDWAGRPWWGRLQAGAPRAIGDVSRPLRMQDASFEVAAPMRDEAGALRGLVVSVVDPNRLDRVIVARRSGGAAVSLVDSSGWLAFRQPPLEPPHPERDWGALYPGTVRPALAGKEAAAVEFSAYQRGRRVIGAAPVAGTGWVAGAGRPEPEAMAPVREELEQSALLLLVVTLGGLLGALLIARAIVGPLQTLREQAVALGEGDRAQPVAARGPADLAALARAFNQMAQRVRERTAEVQRQYAIVQARNRVFDLALRAGSEEELGETCLAVAQELTGSEISFVGRLNGDGLCDIAISNPGWEACTMADQTGHRRPPGNLSLQSIYGRVLTEGQGFYTNDPEHHPDRLGLPEGHPPLTSFLGVPLREGGQMIGMVAVGNRPGGYTGHELAALEGLAPAIAQALQRKQAEAALRESEATLRAFYDSPGLLSGIVEMAGGDLRYLSANRATAAFHGGTPDEITGRWLRELGTPPELRELYLTRCEQARQTGGAVTFEVARPHADGDRQLMLTASHLGAGPTGLPRFAFAALDVTARKQAEEALRASEEAARARAEELQAVLDAANVAVWMAHDPECRVITGNAYGDTLLRAPTGSNTSRTAAPGESPVSFYMLRDGAPLAPEEMPAQVAARTGQVVPPEDLELRFDDGQSRHVVFSAAPLFDARGQVRGSVTTGVDVTPLRAAQDQLLEAERARARLAHALTSEIGHRTKNNLTIVAGLLQVQVAFARDGLVDIGVVRDAVARIQTFAALQEQMYQAQTDTVEMVDALHRIADVTRRALAAQDVTLAVAGDPVRYPAKAGTNLCVVANELLTNALKHGGPGTAIEAQVNRADGLVTLSVWNSGPPVPAGFAPQGHPGAGLQLVSAIAAEYGGRFRLVPERGGTLAELTLPEARLQGE